MDTVTPPWALGSVIGVVALLVTVSWRLTTNAFRSMRETIEDLRRAQAADCAKHERDIRELEERHARELEECRSECRRAREQSDRLQNIIDRRRN